MSENVKVIGKDLKAISSREVAEMMEVEHKNLLRKIDEINEDFNSSKVSSSKYWIESSYKQANGKSNREFLVTKRGCEFLAHKSTGSKGNLFTDRYMDKFEEMEEEIKNPFKNLTKEIQAIFLLDMKQQELESKVFEVKSDLTSFKEDFPLMPAECDEISKVVRRAGIEILGGYSSKAYMDKKLRAKVFVDLYRQLRREFGVNTYKAIKRKYLDLAIEKVNGYDVAIVLKEEIDAINEQMAFA